MYSEYGAPLVGDLVVEFSGADQVPKFPMWVVPVLVAIVFLATLLYMKTRRIILPNFEQNS
jgi:hypothetical protein